MEPVFRTLEIACSAGMAVSGSRITYLGLENISDRGGAVVAINHTSYLDWMPAALAAPGPRFVRVMVDVRALAGPDFAVINPERPVGPAVKLAVTAIGPVRVAVVEAFAGLATGPVQP